LSEDEEQMEVLTGPRLGRLSTTLSSTSPFVKSIAAEAMPSLVRIMNGHKNRDNLILLPLDLDTDVILRDFFDLESRLLVNLNLFGKAK